MQQKKNVRGITPAVKELVETESNKPTIVVTEGKVTKNMKQLAEKIFKPDKLILDDKNFGYKQW